MKPNHIYFIDDFYRDLVAYSLEDGKFHSLEDGKMLNSNFSIFVKTYLPASLGSANLGYTIVLIGNASSCFTSGLAICFC